MRCYICKKNVGDIFIHLKEYHQQEFERITKILDQLFFDSNFNKQTCKQYIQEISWKFIYEYFCNVFEDDAIERTNLLKSNKISNTLSESEQTSDIAIVGMKRHNYSINNEIIQKNIPEIISNKTMFCPICNQYITSMKNHINFAHDSIHEKFFNEQEQLICNLFYKLNQNEYKTNLKEKGIYFSSMQIREIWKKNFDDSEYQKKDYVKKYFYRKTNSDNLNKIINYLKNLDVIDFDYYDFKFKPLDTNKCSICGEDISEMTLYNHLISKNDEKHALLLKEQLIQGYKIFFDLTISNNPQYQDLKKRGIYLDTKIINFIWKHHDKLKNLYNKRLLLYKNVPKCNIPYTIKNKMNWILNLDWEALKHLNKKIQLNEITNNNKCPICNKDIEHLMFEHLSINRNEKLHLQLLENQIMIAKKIFEGDDSYEKYLICDKDFLKKKLCY